MRKRQLQRELDASRRHADILRGRVEELAAANNKLWSAVGRLTDRLAEAEKVER